MTESQRINYLNKLGNQCPYCNSQEVIIPITYYQQEDDNFFTGKIELLLSCQKCNKYWEEVYKLIDVRKRKHTNE